MIRIFKRLLAILTCLLGLALLPVAALPVDLAMRALAIIAGLCLAFSGAIRFWLLRRRKWAASDPPY